jgi:hypothetical protein
MRTKLRIQRRCDELVESGEDSGEAFEVTEEHLDPVACFVEGHGRHPRYRHDWT